MAYGAHSARQLSSEEVQATIDYIMAGHSAEEAAAHFGRHASTVHYRLRLAGYGYNAHTGRWEVL